MELITRNLFKFAKSLTSPAPLGLRTIERHYSPEINIKITNKAIDSLFESKATTDLAESFDAKLVPSDGEDDKLYKFVELELRGNDPAVLKSYQKFAVTSGNHLGINAKAWAYRKPTHHRYTVLKSVHIYKKHRVQYEFRTYFSFIQFQKLTGSTTDTLLEYLERNLPEGVALKATKVEIQRMPDYLVPPK